jgi:hypothetical protein
MLMYVRNAKTKCIREKHKDLSVVPTHTSCPVDCTGLRDAQCIGLYTRQARRSVCSSMPRTTGSCEFCQPQRFFDAMPMLI